MDQVQACRKLVHTLVADIPHAPQIILDVGCGHGGSTAILRDLFPAADMTGINLSAEQLWECRRRVPDIQFIQMDAAALDFEDDSFDTLFSIEAAFHFQTRKAFLAEAWRVLKPGGCILITDICLSNSNLLGTWMVPEKNFVHGMQEYEKQWHEAGFCGVMIEDISHKTWRPFCKNMSRSLQSKPMNLLGKSQNTEMISYFNSLGKSGIDHYVRVQATKTVG